MDSLMTSSCATPLRFYCSRIDCLQSVVGTLAHTFCACIYSPCRSKQSPRRPCGGTGHRCSVRTVASRFCSEGSTDTFPLPRKPLETFRSGRVPGSTSVRTVGIVWDSCPRARSRTAARTTPRRSKTKQSCIDDLEKVVLTAIYAGFWVILTGRAEYAACQSTSSPNVFQNLTLRAQYLKMWKLNDAYFIDQPISNIICTFDNFFSDMFWSGV